MSILCQFTIRNCGLSEKEGERYNIEEIASAAGYYNFAAETAPGTDGEETMGSLNPVKRSLDHVARKQRG